MHPSESKLQKRGATDPDLLQLVTINLKHAQKAAVENHFPEAVMIVACKIEYLLHFFRKSSVPEPAGKQWEAPDFRRNAHGRFGPKNR